MLKTRRACVERHSKLMRLLSLISLAYLRCEVAANEVPQSTNGDTHNSTAAPSISPAPTVAPRPTALPTMNPTFFQLECYDNLTLLARHVMQKDPFQPITFNLCPNTVFDVGFEADGELICCTDGQSPILPRSNTRIYCGPDGNPANNCTVNSGEFQVLSSYTNFFEQNINFEIRGVTFARANYASALLGNGGDIAFKDCRFRDNGGVGTIISFHSPPDGVPDDRRRSLLEDAVRDMDVWERIAFATKEYKNYLDGKDSILISESGDDEEEQYGQDQDSHQGRRKLDDQDWKRQMVLFEGCEFFRNKQGRRGGDEKYGIVTVEAGYDDMEIRNCYFHDNEFGNPLDARGYAIYIIEGSKLSLSGNCFVNNNLVGEGAVIVESGDDLQEDVRNFVTQDDGLQCQFVAQQPKKGALECIGSPVEECTIQGVEVPESSSAYGLFSSHLHTLIFAVSLFYFGL